MTVVEDAEFTCHVCGTVYASRVVRSTNSLLPSDGLPPAPACPYCEEPARFNSPYQPGRMLDLFTALIGRDGIDPGAIAQFVRYMTSAEDILPWRKALARDTWGRSLAESLQRSVSTIEEYSAQIRSAEPFGIFNQMRYEATKLPHPSAAVRHFAQIPIPKFESWPQMNRELRALMDADPMIEQGALETIAMKWGGIADRERTAIALWRDGSLRAKAQEFLAAVEQEYAEQLRLARERIAAAGKTLPPPQQRGPRRRMV